MPDALSSSAKNQSNPALVAAEQRARAFLAEAKWRKARDEIKPLLKADRGRYLPLLLQANIGLAQDMVAKGQTHEAREVLAYLRTIAPADALRALELQIAGHSERSEDYLDRFVAILCDPAAQMDAAERTRVADHVVLAFKPLPPEPKLASLAEELKAVHAGIEAIAQKRWEGLAETLRAIPHQSPLSHWGLFIKGLAAFHTGDLERAQRFFHALPSGSVPAKASLAYSLASGRADWSQPSQRPSEAMIDAVGRLAGQGAIGRLLLKADQLWTEGKHAESYQRLRDAIRQFPSRSLDWSGGLTDFYFAAPFTMAESAKDAYMAFFDRLLAHTKCKNTVEEMLACRLFALTAADAEDDWGLADDWEAFLRAHARLRPPEPRLHSMAYGWLGSRLASPRQDVCLGDNKVELRSPEQACGYLRRAIELDPTNLEAHLSLCLVYAALNRLSERNRLLDEMTERFPHDKRVLIEAARFCVERQAYLKGIGLLERAWHLDRLDPRIPELILTARFRLARQQYQRNLPDKGRKALSEIPHWVTDKPESLHQGRWTILLRQGVLEQSHGEPSRAKQLFRESRAACPSASVFLFFAHLAYRTYNPDKQNESPFLAELMSELNNAPTAALSLSLLRIFYYWRSAEEVPALDKEANWLKRYLERVLKSGCTRDEARQIVLLCGPREFGDQARAYVKRMLREDSKDPMFRLFQFLLRPTPPGDLEEGRQLMESILAEARLRGDQETIHRAQQVLQGLKQLPVIDSAGEPWEPEEAEEAVEDIPQDLSEALPDFPPEVLRALDPMVDLLGRSSDSDLRRMRKRLPQGISPATFEILVALGKCRGETIIPEGPPWSHPLPSGPTAKPQPRHATGGSDNATQLDLF